MHALNSVITPLSAALVRMHARAHSTHARGHARMHAAHKDIQIRLPAPVPDEPSPGADVAAVDPVPVQMWQG